MKNTIKMIISTVLVFALSVLFLIKSDESSAAVIKSISLCVKTVAPTLFPFLVISDYVLKSGMNSYFGYFGEKLSRKLFKLPGEALFIIFMSMVGGFPVGAKMISQSVEKGTLSYSQGKRMMCFCVSGGPAFIISTVGKGFFTSAAAGVIMLLSLTVSSILLGIASSFFASDESTETIKKREINSGALSSSVEGAVRAIINICAWIVVFSAAEAVLNEFLSSEEAKKWICVFLEVTGGCKISAKSFPIPVCTFVLGWSGLAVHFQIMPYLEKCRMKYKYFAVSRLVHASLSAAISYVLFEIFQCSTNVSVNVNGAPVKMFSVSAPAAMAMLFMSILFILDLAPKKKV